MTNDRDLINLISKLEKELSCNSGNLSDWKSALHHVDIFFERSYFDEQNTLDIMSDYHSVGAIFRIFYNQLDDVIKNIEKQEERCLDILKEKVI
ncbi:hypothetical protein HB904_16790 [Listeria booriae]|uniref:Uncharacterized protein n=1 Tax=Listeria booriae TaxID=1552123 RepID=A0A842AFJ3_9LIST|nr:hypothetical protein [Listeria booriae]MBC1402104.1 hypothetical protein [Listeria booriae]MBC1617836.1 hypothetical protein [Listeria booriae]